MHTLKRMVRFCVRCGLPQGAGVHYPNAVNGPCPALVNSHAKLLEALEQVMDYLSDPANPKAGQGATNTFRKARAAIAEAKGE